MESLFPTVLDRGEDRSPRHDDEAPLLGGAFGVYDEGDGLFSLYLTPIDAACLARALDALDLGGSLVDVTPERGPGPVRPVSREALPMLADPLELVHATSLDEAPDEPVTLMVAPHHLIDRDGRSVLGFSLHDRDHGCLYTRDPRVLEAVLTTWLAQIVDTLAAPGSGPPIPEHTLASVMAPLPPQAWRQVVLERSSRFWSLDLSAKAADAMGQTDAIDDLTWVGGPGRAWRAGWSW